MGHDDTLLFKKIEDCIIKTVISCEHVISNATDMYCPAKSANCFELFGFDILIDSNLEPWLLEVNLTPALSCDSPLDQKIKSNAVADLFSLSGVQTLEARINQPVYKKAVMAYQGPPSVHNGLLRKNKNLTKQRNNIRPSRGGEQLQQPEFNSNTSTTAGIRSGSFTVA